MPTLFPTISICNINQFVSENASALIKSIVDDNINQGLTMEATSSAGSFMANIEIANVLARSVTSNPLYGDKERKLLGYSLDSILYKCLYNKAECNASDFAWYYSFHNGNCFRFNSGMDADGNLHPLVQSTMAGQSNGLNLIFFLKLPKNKYAVSNSNGLKIFVHNSSFSPLSSEAIDVKPGTLTNIGIKRSFTYKYPYPYSECIDLSSFDSILYRYFIKNNKTYRQSDCFDLCFQKIIIDNCGCYYLNFPQLFGASACLSLNELLCAADQYIKFIDQSIKKQCSILCPLGEFSFFLGFIRFC